VIARTYEVDDESSVGGAAGGPAEVGDAERGWLRREGGPEAAGVGVGVTEVEHGQELAPPLAGSGVEVAAAQGRRQEQLPRGRDPHRREKTTCDLVWPGLQTTVAVTSCA
jgi:hypothetical protein